MVGSTSPLDTFAPQREDIQLADGICLTVRALSLDDIQILVSTYGPSIIAPLRSFRAEPIGAVLALLEVAPRIIGHAIALAADHPDSAVSARRLPIGVMLKILFAIDRLTFGPTGERRPFAEFLGPMVRQHFPAVH